MLSNEEFLMRVDRYFPKPTKHASSGDPQDDHSLSIRQKEWQDLEVSDFEASTFSLADCANEERVAFLGLAMALSVKERKYMMESIRYLFFESSKRPNVPITERNKFLRENLNEAQKVTFLEYCKIMLKNAEPEIGSYWKNLLGVG
ncbi:MAG: hypothetical protein AAFR73_10145 [Pseudomonadota bacterium]